MDSISILNFIRVNRGFSNLFANIIPNLKVGLYVFLLVYIYSIDVKEGRYEFFLQGVMPYIALVVAAIGIFQRYNILNFNSWFTKYYLVSSNADTIGQYIGSADSGRVVGTLSNPNFYSVQIVIFILALLSNLIFTNKKKFRVYNIILILLLILAMIFTQSRTAIIVLSILVIYIIAIQIGRGEKKNLIRYLLIGAGIAIMTYILIRIMGLNYLFSGLKNGLKTHSFILRIERWNDALNLFKLHPIVGIGPVIGKYLAAVDNEYIHILRNYGILGLAAHLIFYIYVFIVSFKDIFSKRSTAVSQYAFLVNCSITAVLVFNLTLATFYHWRNFVLLLVIIGMWTKAREISKEIS
jgi:O-antigen ligase